MRLLDLIEQHDAVRLAAYLLGELAGLVIADIAGRRADDARDGELLHKFGHIKTDKRFGRIEHIRGKALDKLRLADAGAADKDEADGLALDLKPDAAALYCGADSVHGFVLTDNVFLQALVKLCETLELILLDGGGGYLRPQLDDAGEVIGSQSGARVLIKLAQLVFKLHLFAPELRDAGIALILLRFGKLAAVGREGVPLKAYVLKVALCLHAAVDVLILEVHIRAGLIDKVDGLIGQEAVCNIPLAHHDGLTAHLIGDGDAVVILIIMCDAAQDLHAVLDRRLRYGDGLEAALKRGVLLYVLAVLGEGSRADDLNFAS